MRSPAAVVNALFLCVGVSVHHPKMFILVTVLCAAACYAVWRSVYAAPAGKQKCDDTESDDEEGEIDDDMPPPPARRPRQHYDPVLAVFYRPRADTLVDALDVYKKMRGQHGDWRDHEAVTVGDVVRTLSGDGDADDADEHLWSVYTSSWYNTGRWRSDQKFWELFTVLSTSNAKPWPAAGK